MARGSTDAGSAKFAYEALAAAYDDFTHGYQNDRWTGRLLDKAKELGLAGNRLLDVGCGTGKSFLPMLDRGWEVTACDVSPSMLELARAKVGEGPTLLVADMRDLPVFGEFDLVWALDDVMNYLLSNEELEAALSGMARNLTEKGILAFDLNTLLTYRTFFCAEHAVEQSGRRFIWRGEMAADRIEANGIQQASFEAPEESLEPHIHRQRHFGKPEVARALTKASLDCRAIVGDLDGDLFDDADEAAHTKLIYFCRKANPVPPWRDGLEPFESPPMNSTLRPKARRCRPCQKRRAAPENISRTSRSARPAEPV